MSDTGQNRFEVDLDEIERQLRRSAPAGSSSSTPAYAADPLAELARIVGQDDPFSGVFAEDKKAAPPSEPSPPPVDVAPMPAAPIAARGAVARPAPPASQAAEARTPPISLSREEREVLGGDPPADRPAPVRSRPGFDPVADAYPEPASPIEDDDFQPLAPRRSRGRIAAVLAVLLLAAAGAWAAFSWRNGSFVASGPPPLIQADTTPLKVPPDNPGGMEIPNQTKQIYERESAGGKSRVLDRQEQPIDVRTAARSMPSPEPPLPAPAPAPAAIVQPPAPASPPVAVTPPAPAPSAVASILGEPRRVRTVSVRPDGSMFPPNGSAALAEPSPNLVPTTNLPPPVHVPTVSVPANGIGASGPMPDEAAPAGRTVPAVLPPERPRDGRDAGAPAPSIGSLAAAIATPAAESPAPAAVSEPDAPAVGVPSFAELPPPRPTGLDRRVAAIADLPAEGATAPTDSANRTFAVQIATRPTEQEARTAWDRLSERFIADLAGKPATVTSAEVNGRTVHRIRVTPLARAEANTLCTRLKARGGQCFVVAN